MRRLTVGAVLAVAGCAGPAQVARYDRQNTSHEQFMADRFECLRASQKSVTGVVGYGDYLSGGSDVVVSRGMFDSCMAGKGYARSQYGQHSAPPGTWVRVVD